MLEGSVRKAGSKVRITGQLIDANAGVHLWADRFDGSLDDIFELQDKVTSSVVAAIAPRLEQAEIDRAERKPTENLDAVDLYYRAIQFFRRMNREDNENALRLARQAISLNPKFAAAYGVALACFSQRWDASWMEYVDDGNAEAKQYALRAVELGAEQMLVSFSRHPFGAREMAIESTSRPLGMLIRVYVTIRATSRQSAPSASASSIRIYVMACSWS